MPKRWATLPQGIRWLAGIAVVVLALAIVWALFVPVADWLAHHDVGSVTGSLHETALDNARGRLLTLGAGLFAAGALVFTARNFTLSREGQVTDRYTKAIEQLGSDKLDVRIGGIYALERVARDSARDHPTVMEVLTAFIREHSHEQWPPTSSPDGREPERSTRPDVQAAVTVVGRRDARQDIRAHRPHRRVTSRRGPHRRVPRRRDLTGADLTGANLTGANLAARGPHRREPHRRGPHRRGPHRREPHRRDLTGADLAARSPRPARDLTGADLRRRGPHLGATSPARTSPARTSPARTSPSAEPHRRQWPEDRR